MIGRRMPDGGALRWMTCFAALAVMALAPADGEAQRPRLLGRPAAPPADTLRLTPPSAVLEGSAAPAEEPAPLGLPNVADDRGAFPVAERLEVRSTAYCLRGNMRTGVRVRDGMAAGDPRVLPLGSVIRVSHPDGRLVGIFVIMDTGGAIRGNKIDLWFSSCAEARAWGIRNVVAEVLDIGRV